MSKYISLENLERYDAKMQDRAASFCASKEDGMWRQTDKAGAVSFWPVGSSPLEGTVEFMFKETPPASGDKSPTNPSAISGMSSVKVTRCGKNIIRRPYYYGTRTINGVTFTVNEDGSITVSGTATARCVFWVNNNPSILLVKGEGYIISGCPSGGGWGSYSVQVEIRKDGMYVGAAQDFGASETRRLIAAGDTARTAHVFIEVASGTTVSNLVFRPQLELGSAATAFEPYSGADYAVNLGSTYYGGSIDLATGLMTVTSQKVLLDASCSFGYYAGASDDSLAAVVVQINPLPVANGVFVTGRCACNKFPIHTKINGEESISLTSPTYPFFSKQIRVYLKWTTLGVSSSASSQEIIAAAKAWFTENQVELVVTYEGYSSTVTLTPTQILSLAQTDKYTPRLNTVYSDADNVQIVYQKNPVRDKFEKVQAIIAQGGNV